MEPPYVQVKSKPFLAPLDEMEEIVISSLVSNGYGQIHCTEYPKGISATKTQRTIYGERQFTKDTNIEIQWIEDPNPPPVFTTIAKDRQHINAILVTVQLKDMQANQVQAKANLEIFLKELNNRAQQTSDAVAVRTPPTDHGTAQWASLSQLIAEDYVQECTNEDISTRLILGTLQGRLITVPKRFTEAHAIIQGPPGSGKSRTIINTQLIERLGTSAIVTEVTAGEDLKPTVYGITAGYRAKNGHKIYYINPSDLAHSTRFNPIDFVESIDDAIYYADLIITNTTANTHIGDQIWTQSETHLLTALLLYARGLGNRQRSVEGGKSNLGHVRSLLRLGPVGLQKVIQENGINEAKAQFEEFIRNSSPNFRLGVFSGLIQRLNPWLNPKIRKLTEITDFDPDEVRKTLFTFYLAYPVHRRDYKPIMALALNFLIRLPLRTEFVHPLTYILDEFAAYGRIPGIDDLQATIRNRRIGIILGFQDLQQLAKVYSQAEAEVLFTNCDTKIIFATGSPRAQDQVSKLVGQTTKIKKTVSGSGHIHRQTYGCPLLASAEVGRIQDQRVLILRNKRNPILLTTSEPSKYERYVDDHPLSPRAKPHTDPRLEKQSQLDSGEKYAEVLVDQKIPKAREERVYLEKPLDKAERGTRQNEQEPFEYRDVEEDPYLLLGS